MALIELTHVKKSFDGKSGAVHAVNDVSLQVEKRRYFMASLVIQVPAKSTLVRLLNGLELPFSW